MFNQYPRTVYRNKRVIYSKEGLKYAVQIGAKVKKVCIMSLYPYREILDKKPVLESAIIDCILWEGKRGFCEAMIRKFNSYPSILMFDGGMYIAIIFKESTVEELQRLHANTKLDKMFLIPGCMNYRTGIKCKIIERNNI